MPDDFQRRASQEGRQVQEIASKVLKQSGFSDLRPNEVIQEIGVTVNFIGNDRAGREWFFDVSGAFTSTRAGLIRTDTMWKTLGRANVLHQSGVDRLVLLTTNMPKVNSVGHRALTAAAETYFDAIEMLATEGRARLKIYAGSNADSPLPGLRPAASVYPRLTTKSTATGLQRRVPVPDVEKSLPSRATLNLVVMPHRLKVFLPSKDSSGVLIKSTMRDAATERIRLLLADSAGGCTIVPAVGSWVDPIGGEMFEKVVLIEAYADKPFTDRLINEVVSVLFSDLGQHTAVDREAVVVRPAVRLDLPIPHGLPNRKQPPICSEHRRVGVATLVLVVRTRSRPGKP